MGLRTGEVTVTSGMLLLVDASDLFTKDEWTRILMSSQGSQDAPRVILEAVSKKMEKNLSGKAQVVNIQSAGALPTYQDRQTLTVFLRGVGITDL